jgi:Bacteriophage Mu, Gp27
MRRRRSVIAALPKEVRDEVNRKLEAGVRYAQVCAWLVEQGHVGITERHMMRWYHGGFSDWRREQARLDEAKGRQEFAAEFMKQSERGNVQEASLQYATSQLFSVVCQFDPEALRRKLLEKPEEYTRMLNTLARLSKGSVELEKFKLAASKVHSEDLPRGEGGIRPETLERIKKELKLF